MSSAMVRMLLMTTPSRIMPTKLHSHRLDAALKAPAGAARWISVAAVKKTSVALLENSSACFFL